MLDLVTQFSDFGICEIFFFLHSNSQLFKLILKTVHNGRVMLELSQNELLLVQSPNISPTHIPKFVDFATLLLHFDHRLLKHISYQALYPILKAHKVEISASFGNLFDQVFWEELTF